MIMKITTAAVIFMGSMMLMRADQLVESVQQALKDEGFYYGEVNGDLNANLTAAIRRYQIRNGLQITGELNDETLKSLGVGASGSRTAVKATPTTAPDKSDMKAPLKREPEPEQTETETPTNPMTGQPFPEPPRQNRQPRDDSLI